MKNQKIRFELLKQIQKKHFKSTLDQNTRLFMLILVYINVTYNIKNICLQIKKKKETSS